MLKLYLYFRQIKKILILLFFVFILLLGQLNNYVFASVKQLSCNYNIVTFDLMHNIHLPPSNYQPIWSLAFPDISLKDLRLVYDSQNYKDYMLQVLDLDRLVRSYPIKNTYLENNIKFILTDQIRLLKRLKTDKEKLKQFRLHTKQLLERFLKGTDLYNKYINFIKTYKIKTNYYNLSHLARKTSLKKAELLQSSSPYQSIKLTNIGKISSNNTQNIDDVGQYSSTNNGIIQLIESTISFIRDNWWIILGVLLYLYIMFIIIKKR